MDFFGWFGFVIALSAAGSAATALTQIAGLRNEITALKEDLRRRGVLEHAKGEQTLILPEGFDRK